VWSREGVAKRDGKGTRRWQFNRGVRAGEQNILGAEGWRSGVVGRNDNEGLGPMGLVEGLSGGDRRDRRVIRDDARLVLDVVTLGSDQFCGMKNEPMTVRCAVIGGDRGGTAATLGYVR
jgi:hypothetical protein